MKYCSNCGRQLQDNEECNCLNASTEASETVASAEEGAVTETDYFMDKDSEDVTTSAADTSKNSDMNQDNQTFQNNQFSQGNQATQENQAFQGNQATQGNQAFQGNQTFQGNANDFTQAGPTPKQKTAKNSVFSTALKNIFPFIKAFVKTPSNALHTSAENTDLPLAGIFYALYCISWILFQVFAFSKLFGLFSGVTNSLIGFTGSYIKISYPYVIIVGLISSLLLVVITNVFMIFLGLITRSKYNFKQIVAASSGIFVFPAICFLLATIFFFLSIPLSICVLIVGNVAYLLLFFYTGKTLFQKNDNSPFLWIMILLTAILLIITTLTTAKISLSFSSKLVKTETSYNLFGDDYYEDSLDDFYQFFE